MGGLGACFVELIRCSRPWACFGELKRRFPFSAAQVLLVFGPGVGSIFDIFGSKKLIKIQHNFYLIFGPFGARFGSLLGTQVGPKSA